MSTLSASSTPAPWPVRWLASLLSIIFKLTLIVLVLLAAWRIYNAQPSVQQPKIISLGPTVQQVQQLSELVTVRVCVADVLTGADERWIGDVSIAVLVKGDGLIAVDLTGMEIRKDVGRKAALLILPRPRLAVARVDHERSRVWDVRRGWAVLGDQRTKRLYESAFLHAQRLVEQAASQDEWIEKARLQAEALLKGFYAALGWTIEVKWMDRPEPSLRPGARATTVG